MTISVNNRAVGPYVAAPGQTVFTFDFPIRSAADLFVLRRRAAVESALVNGADFTLSLTPSGGTVTLTAGSLAGDILSIIGMMPIERSTQFLGYRSLPPTTVESEFDNLVKMMQELRRDTDATLKPSYITGDYDLGGHVIHNLGAGSLPTDAARLQDIINQTVLDAAALAAEAATRAAADLTLQYNLDVEASTRSGADTTEQAERIGGDNALRELFALGASPPASVSIVLQSRATISLTSVDPTVLGILVLSRALPGDGGGGLYTRMTSAPSPATAFHVQSANGVWFELYTGAGVNLGAIGGLGDGVGNNAALLNAALDVSDAIYLPDGDYLFNDYDTMQRVIAASVGGPGRLMYNNGFSVDEIGGTLLAGLADPAGNLGETTQGGFGIGGRGPGPNFTLLYGAHPQWVNLQPTYRGGGVELQLYGNQIEAIATTVNGTGFIDASYGSFNFPELRADDVIGYAGSLYRIKTLVSNTRIELQTVARGAVSFAGATSGTFYHCFMYATGTCNVNGISVTRVSGDYLFGAAPYADQSHIKIDGTWHRVASIQGKNALTLIASGGTHSNVPFIQRILPNSLEMTLFRLQALKGGSEEGFAVYTTIDSRVVIESSYAGSGKYLPLTFRTGPNTVGSREHFQITKDGRIMMGGWDAVSPVYGFPLDVKAAIWNDTLATQASNNSARTPVFGLFSTFAGNAPRYLETGFFANFNGAYLQSWVVPNVTPGITTINPMGGGVGFNTGARSILATDYEFVGGMQLTDSSFGFKVANTTTQQIQFDGKAGNRWRFISTIDGGVDGNLVVQHTTDGYVSNFTNAVEFLPNGGLQFSLSIVANYADDTAAAVGGVGLGQLYRTGSDLRIRSI